MTCQRSFHIVALLRQMWYFDEQKKYANAAELMSNDKFRFESELNNAKPEPADVDLRMPLFFCRVVSRRRLLAARGPNPPWFHLSQHRGSHAGIVVAVSRAESPPGPLCLLVKWLSTGRAGLEYKDARMGSTGEARIRLGGTLKLVWGCWLSKFSRCNTWNLRLKNYCSSRG